jgi:hypothetical protein
MKEFEEAIDFKLNMVTLLSHTSHAFQPLDVTCFKPFKNAYKRERNFAMVVNNYFELNKITLARWADKALEKSLKKYNIKSRFRVYEIWQLNLATMVESLV